MNYWIDEIEALRRHAVDLDKKAQSSFVKHESTHARIHALADRYCRIAAELELLARDEHVTIEDYPMDGETTVLPD